MRKFKIKIFKCLVTPEGKYIKKGEVDKKAHYSTMMFARIHIIHVSFSRLAQAATIATRYSCVRKQGLQLIKFFLLINLLKSKLLTYLFF